jgi:hypothetical protein
MIVNVAVQYVVFSGFFFSTVAILSLSNSILQYKEKLQSDSKAPKRKSSILGDQ